MSDRWELARQAAREVAFHALSLSAMARLAALSPPLELQSPTEEAIRQLEGAIATYRAAMDGVRDG